jgi:nucleoside-diphosphate-sugar epimerase
MAGGAITVVAGAGGFIGGHLVRDLRERGVADLRAVDVKPPEQWFQRFDDVDNRTLDLMDAGACREAVEGAGVVYDLAADMGGMGFIENNKARCMLSVLIGTHLLTAAQDAGVDRFFFASSACVYAEEHQTSTEVVPLREEDAYPAMPEDGYGWEKLFTERMCRHFFEDFGLQTRVARFHNIYGPHGSYDGGREKAPAAICRKVVQAELDGSGRIEIWGDGLQTRSFTYIEDCLTGIHLVTDGDHPDPVNVGSSELVTINQLVDLVEDIAGLQLDRHHQLDAPQGVRGRNSDNTLIRKLYDWEPSTSLRTGVEHTYRWIRDQMTG